MPSAEEEVEIALARESEGGWVAHAGFGPTWRSYFEGLHGRGKVECLCGNWSPGVDLLYYYKDSITCPVCLRMLDANSE